MALYVLVCQLPSKRKIWMKASFGRENSQINNCKKGVEGKPQDSF